MPMEATMNPCCFCTPNTKHPINHSNVFLTHYKENTVTGWTYDLVGKLVPTERPR